MQQRLKLVDCVIEVHDARVSFYIKVYFTPMMAICLGLVSSAQTSIYNTLHFAFMTLALSTLVPCSDILLPSRTCVYICYSVVEARTEADYSYSCICFMLGRTLTLCIKVIILFLTLTTSVFIAIIKVTWWKTDSPW
jgi:hypothetical protein